MCTAVGVDYARKLVKLLIQFSAKTNITPSEFIECKIKTRENDQELEPVYESFIMLMKHHEFLKLTRESFWTFYKIRPYKEETLIVLIFIIIFVLDEDRTAEVTNILISVNYRYSQELMQYFTTDDNLVEITQLGCKIFDNHHVLSYILNPLLNKTHLIIEIYERLCAEEESKNQRPKKPPIIPHPPACSTARKHTPCPPLNTPEEIVPFKSTKIPKAVFKGDAKVQESIKKAKLQNKEKVLKLLHEAQSKPFKCSIITKKQPPPKQFAPPPIKPTKVPPKKNVAIKKNVASLMREAAVLVKDKESEMKKLEMLTQTIFDPTVLENLENELMKCKEQEYIQDVERKHLQGLLTHEEAILAKQKVLRLNQEKMEQFKLERSFNLEEIEKWKLAEQEKLRLLVEKSQNIEQAARDAEKKLHQEKCMQARMVERETKDLLREAYVKQQEDLSCKIRLIQELRALHQIRACHVKEFDPTEASNLGLLCEMSIAELRERLNLLRIEVVEELEERKKAINESRQRQQQLIEDVQHFISQSRTAKPKSVPRAPCKLEQTPEIIALRERLQQAKLMRMGAK